MKLIINQKKVYLSDYQISLIKQILHDLSQESLYNDLDYDDINMFMDIYKREFMLNELILFFKKGKVNLSIELTLELIGIMCNEYYNVFADEIYQIEILWADGNYDIEDLQDMKQEIHDNLYNFYFKMKNYMSDIEYMVKYLIITLMGELVYPIYDGLPSISEFEDIDNSIKTFNNFIEYIKEHFENGYENC